MARVIGMTLQSWVERLHWESMRLLRGLLRRFGWTSLLVLLMGVVFFAVWLQATRKSRELETVRHAIQEQKAVPQTQVSDNSVRLKAFEDHLLPHDDIPAVVEEIMRLAENEHLVFQRGEYKPEVDSRGNFMRYRMVLPVKGEATAIRSFMHKALTAQKNLALESVQFRREKIETDVVEASIYWLLLTRIPKNTSPSSGKPVGGAS